LKLGIDFGTTRTVVAAVDRGNYPLLSFEDGEGNVYDWFPSLLAINGSQRRYGWAAWDCQALPDWTIVRSLKRVLDNGGPHTILQIADQQVPLMQVLHEMASAIKVCLPQEPHEIMLGVPANANSNQRFLTSEAFRSAGFDVIGLLNEPSAASIEFGHRNQLKGHILVYDLGGGTFDASLVEIGDRSHRVVATEGIPTLGGDDFDHLLADLAVNAETRAALSQGETFRLMEECRVKKEALNANSRKITLELDNVWEGWGTRAVAVSAYYEQCRPLMDETVHLVEDLLAAHPEIELEALYVTGGGSELPIVSRVLKETFGRRVRRSDHARSATAIGLAIQTDVEAGYVLRERFTRYFGVWREGEAGQRIIFDPLFEKGTVLPAPGEPRVEIYRAYYPVHNIGVFRYLECTHLGEDGQPSADVTVWDEIRFPFDPRIQDAANAEVAHSWTARTQHIEEVYTCDASGTVAVRIANLTSGYQKEYRLGRWASKEATIVPGRRGGEPRKSGSSKTAHRRRQSRDA
jgi:molecular chaperone DnaK (HSP70)